MPFSFSDEIAAATLASVKSYGKEERIMVDVEDVVRATARHSEIIKRLCNGSLEPDLVLAAYQRIIEGRFYNPVLIHDMFVSPEAQLANVRSWNTRQAWNFTEEDFRDAETALEQLTWPSDRLSVLVLVPYLASVGNTFDELCIVAFEQQSNHWRWVELKGSSDNLRLLEGIEHKPGLRWEVIDLGANWDTQSGIGISPMDVRDANSAHAGVLAAASHFPRWVQAMDGIKVPYVWVPGYQVTIRGFGAWMCVPCLEWHPDDREVRLLAYGAPYRIQTWAVPVVRRAQN